MQCKQCKLWWGKNCPYGNSPKILNSGDQPKCEHFDGGAGKPPAWWQSRRRD